MVVVAAAEGGGVGLVDGKWFIGCVCNQQEHEQGQSMEKMSRSHEENLFVIIISKVFVESTWH